MIDRERLAAWMDDNGLPGKGAPVETELLSGGTQNEIYEIRPPSRSEILARYAKMAKWKLAVVLEQGFQRAGDDAKLEAFGPVVLDLMRGAAEVTESSDYGR
jgi:hypothetical protein